jgi:hypothetical protein
LVGVANKQQAISFVPRLRHCSHLRYHWRQCSPLRNIGGARQAKRLLISTRCGHQGGGMGIIPRVPRSGGVRILIAAKPGTLIIAIN